MDNKRLEMFIDELGDILSSGQGFGELTGWHQKTIKELFVSQHDTPEEKKEVFENFYEDPEGSVTIEEIKWMMEECGVEIFVLTLTND